MNISEYLSHWDRALEGGIYPEDYQSYLPLNRTRFNRIYKQFRPSEAFIQQVRTMQVPTHWILITEPWCGDAAQSVPPLLRLIEVIPKASYSLELRDAGSLIDQYLTHGSKSIPKLIVRNEQHEDLFVWGARPIPLSVLFNEGKQRGLEKPALHEMLHAWYAKDGGRNLEHEIMLNLQPYLNTGNEAMIRPL